MALGKIYKSNVQANIEAAKKPNIFIKVKEGTQEFFRILPSVFETGQLFAAQNQHFKLELNGVGDFRGSAAACLDTHGKDTDDQGCFLCKLERALKKYGNKDEKSIGNKIALSSRAVYQVLRLEDTGEKDDKGAVVYKHTGPYLWAAPPSAVNQINTIMKNMKKIGGDDSCFSDPDNGQGLFIEHPDQTTYQIDRSSMIISLDEAFPKWRDKMIYDIYDEMCLNVLDYEQQKQAAMKTFGDQIDWAVLAEKFGL